MVGVRLLLSLSSLESLRCCLFVEEDRPHLSVFEESLSKQKKIGLLLFGCPVLIEGCVSISEISLLRDFSLGLRGGLAPDVDVG